MHENEGPEVVLSVPDCRRGISVDAQTTCNPGRPCPLRALGRPGRTPLAVGRPRRNRWDCNGLARLRGFEPLTFAFGRTRPDKRQLLPDFGWRGNRLGAGLARPGRSLGDRDQAHPVGEAGQGVLSSLRGHPAGQEFRGLCRHGALPRFGGGARNRCPRHDGNAPGYGLRRAHAIIQARWRFQADAQKRWSRDSRPTSVG